jgi:hypothetical protein
MSRYAQWLVDLLPRTGRLIDENCGFINQADVYRQSRDGISRGLADGFELINSFGERTSGAAETNYPVWPNGALPAPLINGGQMSVVSSSANDAAAGTHARTIRIRYLDNLLNPQEEIVTLTGTTPALTVATNIRWIQCLHLETVGANAFTAGTVTVSNGGNVYSQINTGKTRCSSGFRMVPNGKRLYVDGVTASSISGTATVRTQIYLVANEIFGEQYQSPVILFPQDSIGLQDGGIAFEFPYGLSFKSGTLVGFLHTSDKAATVAASWFGRLEPVLTNEG